jgi:hypothetical protein
VSGLLAIQHQGDIVQGAERQAAAKAAEPPVQLDRDYADLTQ